MWYSQKEPRIRIAKWKQIYMNHRVFSLYMHVHCIMGNSRKYPYPTTDGFHVLPPPCLRKFQNALPPPCPQNSIIVNPPYPSEFPGFFGKYIFDLATFIWTNEHEFMPPKGCYLAAPGDKLYSSATRITYRVWPGCATFFLSLILPIKKHHLQ